MTQGALERAFEDIKQLQEKFHAPIGSIFALAIYRAGARAGVEWGQTNVTVHIISNHESRLECRPAADFLKELEGK